MAFGDELREFVLNPAKYVNRRKTNDSHEEPEEEEGEALGYDLVSSTLDTEPSTIADVEPLPAPPLPMARKRAAAKPVVVNIGGDGLVDYKHVEVNPPMAQASSSAPVSNSQSAPVNNSQSVPPPTGFANYPPQAYGYYPQGFGFPQQYPQYGFPQPPQFGFPQQMYAPFTMGTIHGQSAPQAPQPVSQCGPRVMSETELIAKYPKAKSVIKQPSVSDKLTPLQQIKLRESEKGIDLSCDYIARHRKKLATVRETIRRLKQLLPQCIAKFELWTSLQDDWDWANDLRGEKKFAEDMDISLKPRAKKQKIDPKLKKKADDFIKGKKNGMEVESESEISDGEEGQAHGQ